MSLFQTLTLCKHEMFLLLLPLSSLTMVTTWRECTATVLSQVTALKFPPTPSKTYVNLAVVKHASQVRDIDKVRKNTLHGRVDKLLEGKIKIEIPDILKPQDNGKPITLVFIEGPPGIGTQCN